MPDSESQATAKGEIVRSILSFDCEDSKLEEVGYYVCDSCGEEISLSLDPSGGVSQDFVEDCPVCCRPMVIRVDYDPDGNASISASRE